MQCICTLLSKGISIHAPREGSDIGYPALMSENCIHFYPRSPRGERHFEPLLEKSKEEFLSTLPARGATGKPQKGAEYYT